MKFSYPGQKSQELDGTRLSQTVEASLSMLTVEVHDSTITKRLNRCGLFLKFSRGKCRL